jgi:hypothetical protein
MVEMNIWYERRFCKPVDNVAGSSSNLINAGSLFWLPGEDNIYKKKLKGFLKFQQKKIFTFFVGDWEVESGVLGGDTVRFNIGIWEEPTRLSRSCI